MKSMSRRRSWEKQIRIDQQRFYDDSNTVQVKLKLNMKTDADILEWLDKQKWDRSKSMQGEIKRLIRDEISREQAAEQAIAETKQQKMGIENTESKGEQNCRCTPTENPETIEEILTDKETEHPERKQYLSRPDVKEYLKQYPDATKDEKARLVAWLKEGNSVYDNPNFVADESGRPMDFIGADRFEAEREMDWRKHNMHDA